MSDQPSKEMVEAAQHAVMIADGCGITIENERTFCDDPRATIPDTSCICKQAGRAAAEAISALSSRSPAPAETKRAILQALSNSGGNENLFIWELEKLAPHVLRAAPADRVEEWPDKTKVGMFLCDLANEDWDDVSRPKYEAEARAILGFVQSEIVRRPRPLVSEARQKEEGE